MPIKKEVLNDWCDTVNEIRKKHVKVYFPYRIAYYRGYTNIEMKHPDSTVTLITTGSNKEIYVYLNGMLNVYRELKLYS